MRNKYYAKKVTVDGHTFASKHEAERYSELKLLERAGQIERLQLQVPFVLLPLQKGEDGKTLERGVKYVADFVYTENGKTVVEDAKSKPTRTPEYVLKRKLLLWIHGIRIREV